LYATQSANTWNQISKEDCIYIEIEGERDRQRERERERARVYVQHKCIYKVSVQLGYFWKMSHPYQHKASSSAPERTVTPEMTSDAAERTVTPGMLADVADEIYNTAPN
jgi:hypothetical protein